MDDENMNILLIEDSPSDAHLLRIILSEVSFLHFELTHVEYLGQALQHLTKRHFDLVLLDLSLPDSQEFDTLVKIAHLAALSAVIVLTGLDNELVAVAAMQAGAQDYLVKDRINSDLLDRAIRYAIERQRLWLGLQKQMKALQQSETHLHNIIAHNADGIVIIDREGRVCFVNPAAERLFARRADELVGDLVGFPLVANDKTELDILRNRNERVIAEMRVVETIWDGKPAYLASLRDITERKQVEAELAQRAAQLMLINDIGRQIAAMLELDAVLDRVAHLVEKGFGYHHVALFLIDGEVARLKAIAGSYRTYFPPDHSQPLNQGIIGWVGRHGEKVVANDARADPRYVSLIASQSITQAELCLPIRAAGQVVGILDNQSPYLNAFSENDVMAMETLTDQIAVAIENARLYQATQQELAERKQTEAALETERYRLRTLIDTLPDLIFLKDRHSRFVVANKAIAQFIGLPAPEALHGKSDFDFYPQELAAHYYDLEQQIIRSGEPVVGWERFQLDLMGNPHWLSTIKMPLRDNQGAIVGLVGIERDITKRRQAEEEVRRRNRELALLNQVISAGTTGIDVEKLLDIACRELALAFNLPQATATLLNEQKTATRVVAEYRAEGRPTTLNNPIPGHSDILLDYVLTPEGPFVTHEAQSDPRLAPIHDLLRQKGIASLLILPLRIGGEVVGTLSLEALEPRPFSTEEINLAGNVAEQVASALSRARSSQIQQRLSTAIEQAAETIIITDTQGIILYVNPAFERSSGYSHTEAIGQTPQILKSGQQEAAFYQKLWATISAGQAWRGRFINQRKDGTLYTEDATITPVRNDSGDIVSYVGVQHDITRELQLEEQYRQAQKMEAVGRLTAGVAHDFNNLLTTINGFTYLIQTELRPDDPIHEMVEIILRSGQRAADLVHQLLAFSRKQVLQPEVLNLNDVMVNIEKMVGRLLREDIDLVTVPGPNLGQIKADPGQIEQVVLNLVVNARDAMPQGGKLTIETANVELDKTYTHDHIGLTPGRYVMLAVTDTGMGMDAEIQSHIFEPFFTTKAQGKGTGLGLASTFGIVKQSGGDIGVYSEVGQGTSFKIYLPRVDEALVALEPQPVYSKLPRGTETVLLVEDEAGVRSLARYALELSGYTVLEASDGPEALRLGQEQQARPIHLLMTDMVMPGGLNGRELAEQLKTLRPELKVLFISGYANEAVVQPSVLEPGLFFLQKPFSPYLLIQKIREVLDAPTSESN